MYLSGEAQRRPAKLGTRHNGAGHSGLDVAGHGGAIGAMACVRRLRPIWTRSMLAVVRVGKDASMRCCDVAFRRATICLSRETSMSAAFVFYSATGAGR